MEQVSVIFKMCINVAETRTGVDEYESMDVDAASGGAGPQRCE